MLESRKNKNYLPVILQSIFIGSFVMGLIYFPINLKFDAISKEIQQVKKNYNEHCIEQKDKFAKVPDTKLVELQFTHIQGSLDDIQAELHACRGADDKLQETLQKILIKLK